METETRNSWGLYDAPLAGTAPMRPLTEETLDAQLAAGAIVLSREEAVAAGFLQEDD